MGLGAGRGLAAVGLLVAMGLVGVTGAAEAKSGSSAGEQTWSQVLARAKGQQVSLWMWGGDAKGNAYIDGFLAPAAAKLGVRLRRVPIADTKDAINRVLVEKQAGSRHGSVDLIWVNGDNFRTGVQAGIWRCGWADHLPNATFLKSKDPLLLSDFGTPVKGCEAPWHKAQFTLVYNADRVKHPPTTLEELLAWAEANPGRFTYPAPPDFTGSAFVRQVLNSVSGGYKHVPATYSQESFSHLAPPLWAELSHLKPYLWRKGETYPQSSVQLDKLYSDGQVDFTMTYGPATLTKLVADGTFPQSTKVLPINDGTLGNASFLGIPTTSGNFEGAEVVANLALSPEQQAVKANPKVWGQFTVLDVTKLSSSRRASFAQLPASKVVPTFEVLSRNANPEVAAEWVRPIDEGWRQNVLLGK